MQHAELFHTNVHINARVLRKEEINVDMFANNLNQSLHLLVH